MRPVVFVAGRDPRGRMAGDNVYLRAHARAAQRAGFEPHIFCTASEAGVHQTPYGRVHLVRSSLWTWPTGGLGFRKSFIQWHAPLLAVSVRRFLASAQGPHLVHGFSTWSCVGPLVARAFRRSRTPVATIASFYTTARHESDGKLRGMTTAHGWVQRLQYRAENLTIRLVEPSERLGYRGADLVTVNYETVRRLLEAAYGPRSGVRRLAYCSESAFSSEAPQPEAGGSRSGLAPRSGGEPMVVSLSRHDARKGVDLLLRALAHLHAAGLPVRACLLGGGELIGAHRALARRLGLEDVVTFAGWVPDPLAYLRQADVFVLPSLQEASGSLAVVEAFQAGVAVVASAIDGLTEDLMDGENALLVPPGDPVALAATLRRLLADAGLRQRLAGRGHDLFRRRFTASLLVEALTEAYADLGVRPAPA